MRTRFIILAFLLCVASDIFSQDKFKVIRSTFLKLNPDKYADNITQIPEGTILTKKSDSDFPYIFLYLNGEVGYVSNIDLEPLDEEESIIESLPLEEENEEIIEQKDEEKQENINEPETSVEDLFKSNKDVEKLENESPFIISNFLPNLKWNKKYLWGFLIIPIIFLSLIIIRIIKSTRKNNKGNNVQFMENSMENLPPIPTLNSSINNMSIEYTEPLKIQRWDNSMNKD